MVRLIKRGGVLTRDGSARLSEQIVSDVAREMGEPIAPPRNSGVRGTDAIRRVRKLPRRVEPTPAGMTRRGAISTQKVETYWTLPYLAKKAGMQEQLARLHLRKAGIKRPGTRWRWLEGSPELERVRKVLKL